MQPLQSLAELLPAPGANGSDKLQLPVEKHKFSQLSPGPGCRVWFLRDADAVHFLKITVLISQLESRPGSWKLWTREREEEELPKWIVFCKAPVFLPRTGTSNEGELQGQEKGEKRVAKVEERGDHRPYDESFGFEAKSTKSSLKTEFRQRCQL